MPSPAQSCNCPRLFGASLYVRSESKTVVLGAVHLERVTCPYVMASLKLQREFGLRREEAAKGRVAVASWSRRSVKCRK